MLALYYKSPKRHNTQNLSQRILNFSWTVTPSWTHVLSQHDKCSPYNMLVYIKRLKTISGEQLLALML